MAETSEQNPAPAADTPSGPALIVTVDGATMTDPSTTAPILKQIHETFVALAANQGGRFPDVTVVLAEDLHAAIAEVTGEPGFTGERLGGIVSGKTVKSDPTWSAATVLLPAVLWPEGQASSGGVLLLAHEFAHCLLGGLRRGQGWRREPTDTDISYAARVIAIECADEIRADCFAEMVLSHLATITAPDGTTRPVTTIDVLGSRTDSVQHVVADTVHPGWTNLIVSYRIHQIDLMTMWNTLCSNTEQVLITLAHTEAEHIVDPSQPSAVDRAPDHPGMKHLIGPVWQALTDVFRDEPLHPSAAEIADSDMKVGAAGEAAISRMWALLGVSATLTDDGTYLHVTDPEDFAA